MMKTGKKSQHQNDMLNARLTAKQTLTQYSADDLFEEFGGSFISALNSILIRFRLDRTRKAINLK